MMMSCITAVLHVSFSDAFPLKKVRLYFSIFMREYVGILLHQGAWSKKLSGKVFTSQRPPTMWLRSCGLARVVNTL
jgi:hypothetical protein